MKTSTVLLVLGGLVLLVLAIPILTGMVSPPTDSDIYTYVDEVTRYWWSQGSQIWEYWSEQFQAWVSAG